MGCYKQKREEAGYHQPEVRDAGILSAVQSRWKTRQSQNILKIKKKVLEAVI